MTLHVKERARLMKIKFSKETETMKLDLMNFSDYAAAKKAADEVGNRKTAIGKRLAEIVKARMDAAARHADTARRAEAYLIGAADDPAVEALDQEESRLRDEREIAGAAARLAGERLDTIVHNRSRELADKLRPEFEKRLKEYVSHRQAAHEAQRAILGLRDTLRKAGARDYLPAIGFPGDSPADFQRKLDIMKYGAKLQGIEL